MKPLLLVAFGRTISSAPLGRREGDIEVRRIPALPTPSALEEERRPIVIALDRALLSSVGEMKETLLEMAAVAALVGIGEPGETEPRDDFPIELLTSFIPGDASVGTVIAQLRGAFRHAASLLGEREARFQEQQRYEELSELTRVGVALSHERDLTTLGKAMPGHCTSPSARRTAPRPRSCASSCRRTFRCRTCPSPSTASRWTTRASRGTSPRPASRW